MAVKPASPSRMVTATALTRRFDSRIAVDNVSFEIRPGEIFALLGPNGAGKTTTIRMLSGLIGATSGTVRIGGEILERRTASRLRARIGILTEAPGLWERLTVHQNLLTYARLYRLPSPRQAVETVLEEFALRDRAGEPAARLSKGLKQRVALARTLLHRPDVVLLDEPTSGLDPAAARGMRDTVLRLRDNGRAVLISTHNLDEVDRLATRVAVIRTALIAEGTPAELRARLFGSRVSIQLQQDAAPFAQALRDRGITDVRSLGPALSIGVGDHPGSTGPGLIAVPELVRHLVDGGARIESVIREKPALEDVYLRLLDEDSARP